MSVPEGADAVDVEMVATQVTEGHQLAVEDQPAATGEAQMLMLSEGAQDRRDVSPPSSELSTGKMNQRAPGWNKRLVLSDRERCCEEGNCSI